MIGRSLATRLIALQQVIAIAVVIVFAASSLWITVSALERREAGLLSSMAGRLARNLEIEFRETHNLEGAARDVLEEESASGVRIVIRDAAGRVVATTAGYNGSSPALRESSSAPRIARRVVVPAVGDAVVETSLRSPLRQAAMGTLTGALAVSAVPLLLITLFLNRWTTRRVLRPLAEMEHRAHHASVETGVRILEAPTGMSEIDQLGRSFDRLLQRLDEVLQSERRFTSDASHELRTPLTVLSGELELALADRALPTATRAGLERAARQVSGMRELVEALLLLRRAHAGAAEARGDFEPVNLSDLTAEATTSLRRRYPDRVADLEVRAPDEALVSGHPVLLASALRNLMDNAIAFTRPGQPVRIAVEADGEATVTVDDGGPGIPPGERERIFDPFFRGAESRASHGGFGLGLPILRQVARVHGGDVAVAESPLGGARFTLRLPSWKAATRPPQLRS